MKNKGFSLVELIVVIAIMAVLVGVIAPQFFGYVKKAKEAVAKDEVYNVVKVANINLMENEINDKYSFVNSINPTEATDEFVYETIDKASAKGTVSSMLVATSSVTYTRYTSPNGVTAIYDITKSPNIYIEEEDENQVVATTKYYESAKRLLSGLDKTKSASDITHSLQQAYADENDGKLPMFTSTDEYTKTIEKLVSDAGLKYTSRTKVDELKWIPSVTNDKQDVIMYAGIIGTGQSSGNINSAALAYYDGNYYYHRGYYDYQIDHAYVGDTGSNTQNFISLASGAESEAGGWVKFEQ